MDGGLFNRAKLLNIGFKEGELNQLRHSHREKLNQS